MIEVLIEEKNGSEGTSHTAADSRILFFNTYKINYLFIDLFLLETTWVFFDDKKATL